MKKRIILIIAILISISLTVWAAEDAGESQDLITLQTEKAHAEQLLAITEQLRSSKKIEHDYYELKRSEAARQYNAAKRSARELAARLEQIEARIIELQEAEKALNQIK